MHWVFFFFKMRRFCKEHHCLDKKELLIFTQRYFIDYFSSHPMQCNNNADIQNADDLKENLQRFFSSNKDHFQRLSALSIEATEKAKAIRNLEKKVSELSSKIANQIEKNTNQYLETHKDLELNPKQLRELKSIYVTSESKKIHPVANKKIKKSKPFSVGFIFDVITHLWGKDAAFAIAQALNDIHSSNTMNTAKVRVTSSEAVKNKLQKREAQKTSGKVKRPRVEGLSL